MVLEILNCLGMSAEMWVLTLIIITGIPSPSQHHIIHNNEMNFFGESFFEQRWLHWHISSINCQMKWQSCAQSEKMMRARIIGTGKVFIRCDGIRRAQREEDESLQHSPTWNLIKISRTGTNWWPREFQQALIGGSSSFLHIFALTFICESRLLTSHRNNW